MNLMDGWLAAAAASIDVIGKGIDVFAKLQDITNISQETKKEARKFEDELAELEFKTFKETCSCKCTKGIPEEKFEEFVERLQKRFDFLGEILDGIFADENKETVDDFHFEDGKGNINHGRFVTLKKGKKMDIAYAVYSLKFEFSEKETEITKQEYRFYFIPGDVKVSIKKEPQRLNYKLLDKLQKWCLVKLHEKVQENGFSDDSTSSSNVDEE